MMGVVMKTGVRHWGLKPARDLSRSAE